MLEAKLPVENYADLFREAMRDQGISYPGEIIADGKIYRFSTTSKQKQNGWYVFYGMAGAYGDWGKGISEKWSVLKDSKRSFSPQEKSEIQKQSEQSQKKANEERLRKQEETAEEAANLWEHASETGTSEYLTIKQVEAYGVRYSADYWGSLVAVPLCDIDGKLWNIQKVYDPKPDKSNKWFLPGGRVKGCFHTLGTALDQLEQGSIVYCAEGYATAASVHRATGQTVVMAIDSGNLEPVIASIKLTYPHLSTIIAADNDCWKEDGKNPGREAANKAAQKHGCSVVFPVFQSEHHPKKPTDFDDLHCWEGLEEVKKQIQLIRSFDDHLALDDHLEEPVKPCVDTCPNNPDGYPWESYEPDDGFSDCLKTMALQQEMRKEQHSHTLSQSAESDCNPQKVKMDLKAEEERTYKKRDIGIVDFLNIEINQRKMIVAPILPEKGLVMLYAARGMGKTWVSAEIAYTASSGGDMFEGKWVCEDPQKVLFVDGEMPASVLQERFSFIALSRKEASPPTNDLLRILASDLLEDGIPDLSTQKGQDFMEPHLEGVKLLILDNISALCRSGRENESESWTSMQEWLLSLRRRGLSVLLIHHAGKGGNQRGNSKKEDLLDTVIALKRPNTYEPKQGARFEVHYEKARGFYGEAAEPFEVQKKEDDLGNSFWEVKGMEDAQLNQIMELYKDGVTQRDIARQVGVGVATVNRTIKKSKD